jgi:Domain of unknown function (DUF1707)/Domain of unknown function (DUF4190)
MTVEPRDRITAGEGGNTRAADADREKTIDMLNDAFAEGRLTKEELAARAERAYGAQTYGDLAAVTADLPAWPPGNLRSPGPDGPAPRPGAPDRTNRLAIAALVCGLIPGLPQLAAVILGIEALRQIRRSGERGTALAMAGAALGMLGLVVAVILVLP